MSLTLSQFRIFSRTLRVAMRMRSLSTLQTASTEPSRGLVPLTVITTTKPIS